MNKTNFCLCLVIALLGGLIGGFLSERVFNNSIAFAKDNKSQKVIEANEFRIVDKNGKIVAVFKSIPSKRYSNQNKEPVPEVATLDFISQSREYDIRLTQDGLWMECDEGNSYLSPLGLLTNSKVNGISVKIGKMFGVLSPIEIFDENKKVLWKAP